MILAAYCLNSIDVSPLMIEVSDGDSYRVVKGMIGEAMQQYWDDSHSIEISEILHGGIRVLPDRSSETCDLYGFCGEPVLFRFERVRRLLEKVRDTPINVKTLTGEMVNLKVNLTDTVADVEFILQRKNGIPLKKARIFFGSRQLLMVGYPSRLFHYGVRQGSTLHVAYPRDRDHGFFVLSVKQTNNKIFFLEARSSDTVFHVKQMIQKKNGCSTEEQVLIVAGVMLQDGRSLLEYGVTERSKCFLVRYFRREPIVTFHDLSNASDISPRRYSENAPDWRTAAPGICLEGLCTNRDCEAHGEVVILNIGCHDIDLARGGTKSCPKCQGDVIPTMCALNNCVWSYKGKEAGRKCIHVSPWTEVGDNYHHFSEGEGVEWERLLIQARPKLARAEAPPATAAPGIYPEGLCTNRDCKALGQMVILKTTFDDYDLARGETRNCPWCQGDVIPTTCTINNCVWRYRGKEAGKKNLLVSPWADVGGSYHRFRASEGVEWGTLLIQARPKLGRADASPAPSAISGISAVPIDHTWQTCTICMGRGGLDRDIVLLECGHRFHDECLQGWEDGSSTVVCPNCRQKSPTP